MATSAGPNIEIDGLVFGYDAGYPLTTNAISSRFYLGEPTVNLYTNSDFNNGETGWTFGSWDGNISHTATTIVGRNGNVVSANKLTVNSASSYSHFHQYNGSKYTSGNTYTTSAWVKGIGTFAIKSHWGGNTNFTMTGDWQRVSMTVTATSNSNSNFPYFAGEGLAVGSTFYITDTQTELNGNATPFVNGTRSSTQSLIDLKETADINVANASFDSNGQPEFDGTDDYIYGFAFNIMTMVNATQEAWVKMDALPTNGNSFSIFGGTTSGHGYMELRNNAGNTAMAHWTNANGWRYSNTNVQANKWEHLIWKWEGLKLTWYLNGVVDGTYTFSTFSPYGCGFNKIGGAFSNRILNGHLPIAKLYNRALTAAEIKSNYNAYKKRFEV